MTQSKFNFLNLIHIATIAVFAGRAYQHLFWDAPYRELFWDPNYMQYLVEQFTDLKWNEYVTHPDGDIWLQRFVLWQGAFYSVCTLVAIFIRKLPRWCRMFLILGALDLIFLAFLYQKDRFYHLGQFLEYSLQFGAPIFLYYSITAKKVSNNLILWMKIAAAVTFISHGLYAIGFYPRPGSFLTMTTNILGCSNETARLFLDAAGILDFVVGVGIFFKNKIGIYSLGYMVLWGFLTAMARIIGNFYFEFPWESLHLWGFESLYRFPHFLIPLAILVYLKSLNGQSLPKPD